MSGIQPVQPFNVQQLAATRIRRLNALKQAQAMQRLATGQRINTGADDPAGLIASESLRATLAALDAETSANERASHQASTADGALGQVSDLLNEAKSLVHANANTAGLSNEEKQANQFQIDSILTTVDRIAGTTSFNGQKLLDGSATLAASGNSLSIASATSTNLGATEIDGAAHTLADLKSGGPLSTLGGGVQGAAQVIDRAINDVSTRRGTVGAFDKHVLQTRIATVGKSREQMLLTVSQIRDTDYGVELSQLSRSKLLESALNSLSRIQRRPQPRVSTFSATG